MSNTNGNKQQMVEKVHSIQKDIQAIFFEVEKFQEYDVAKAAQKKILETIHAVSEIKHRVLEGTKAVEVKDEVPE
jgi:hypothetical protein